MQTKIAIATIVLAIAGTASAAAPVLDTSLPALNGSFGAGTATTTSSPTGTRTTVTGPGGGANRASAANNGSWFQTDVGGGATIGITTDYRHDNGSVYFNTIGPDSKADLTYALPTIVPLSQFSSASFQFFRDGASTSVGVAPVMRLILLRNDPNGGPGLVFGGTLIFDNFSTTGLVAPSNVWTTVSATRTSGNFYTTNGFLGTTFTAGQRTIAQWDADNAAQNLQVIGVNIGVGSGWGNVFSGATDNVRFAFANGPNGNFNFAVAGVPEPSNWAMLIIGFGLVGAMHRRQRSIAPTAL